ncbi:MAG: Ig-like domain-containing protein [Gemmatimonadales bacterium]
MRAFSPACRPATRSALLILLAACGGTGPTDDPDVAEVVVAPATATVESGGQVQLTATLKDAGGRTLTGRTVTWSSSDPTVATVAGDGAVTGVAEGPATITATAESRSGTAAVVVGPAAVATIALGPNGPSGVPGEPVQLSATLHDAGGHVLSGRTVTWSSTDPAKATVDATGLVTGVAVGSAGIQATSESKSATLTFTVAEGGLVGPAGGTITGFAGSIALEVPAGAVATPVALRFSRPGSPPLDATAAAGSEVLLAPSGVTFSAPATLTLSYDPLTAPQGVAEDGFGIRTLQGAAWTPLATQVTNPAPLTVSAAVGGSGTFGVGRLPASAPCPSAQAHQFDFWLGDWDVTPNGSPPGTRAARSHITAEPGGCAVFEDFTDLAYHGVSVNVFDPAGQQWHQTYVDTEHARLLFAGGLVAGDMILTMPDHTSRITWSAEAGGNVRQLGEASTDGGLTWPTVQFDLIYESH